MLDYLITNKATLEIIYLLSAPVMLIGLVIGLFQLYFIKKDLEVKYKREAIRDTLNIFQEKINSIEDIRMKLGASEVKEELEDYPNAINDFSISAFEKNDQWLKDFENAFETYNLSIDLLNEIEQLAQFIQSGLADEELAYSLQGSYFVSIVEGVKHYLAAHRDDNHQHLYSEIITLHNKWSNTIKQERLMKLHKDTTDKINQIPKSKPSQTIGV